MTSYFKPMLNIDNDAPLSDRFPWASWDEFQKDAEHVWEEMKTQGVNLGHLEVTPEGYLKGFGHPDKWFDSVKLNDDTSAI